MDETNGCKEDEYFIFSVQSYRFFPNASVPTKVADSFCCDESRCTFSSAMNHRKMVL
jgi:hypothetical protein